MTNSPVTVPYIFTDAVPNQAPQPIIAAQINANFAAVFAALRDGFSGISNTINLPISGNYNLSPSQATYGGYEFSGPLTGNATITWPQGFAGFAAIENATTGGFSINVGLTGGTFITIPNDSWLAIWSDGTTFASLGSSGSSTTGTGPTVLQNAPTIINPNLSGTVTGTGTIPNVVLQNSAIVINGQTVNLGGSVTIGLNGPLVAKTTNYAVQASDAATIFTNDGASGLVVFTLPAITQLGASYGFALTAGTSIEIDAPLGASIILPAAAYPNGADITTNVLTGATISSGGTGYGNVSTFNATISSGTPYNSSTGIVNVTSSALGVVVTVNSVAGGPYMILPTLPNPTTGGTGTGLLLNLAFSLGSISTNVRYSFVVLTAITATSWFATTIEGQWLTNTDGYYGEGYYSDGYYSVGGA